MPRAIASASVSFGLVSIPVKLYTPTRSESKISFKMLRGSDNSRLKQQYVAVNDGELVSRKEMVKGYEYEKDRFVIVTNEELDAAAAEATRTVEIKEFVPLDAVDPIYYDKAYYLGPDDHGEKPYRLLQQAMMQSNLAGVAQYGARGKAYLVLVRATDEGLIMQQLRYADEVRDFAEVPKGEDRELNDAELNLALQIIAMSTSEEFDPTKYHDVVRAQLEAVIQRKIEGEEVTVSHAEEPRAQVVDLMEALKASIAAKMGGESERKPARRADEEPVALKEAAEK